MDIKPYIPAFDAFPDAQAGWMDLIRRNKTEARLKGYQTIHSARGARATRSANRRRAQTPLSVEKNTSEVLAANGYSVNNTDNVHTVM